MSHYIVCATDDAAAKMEQPGCTTTEPRTSLDGTLSVLKFDSSVAGSMTHSDTLTLMATPEWSDPTGLPQ